MLDSCSPEASGNGTGFAVLNYGTLNDILYQRCKKPVALLGMNERRA
jgi:hypothetical protein